MDALIILHCFFFLFFSFFFFFFHFFSFFFFFSFSFLFFFPSETNLGLHSQSSSTLFNVGPDFFDHSLQSSDSMGGIGGDNKNKVHRSGKQLNFDIIFLLFSFFETGSKGRFDGFDTFIGEALDL